ncbi:MAG: zf-HC2 domain-containing protein [Acidobacteriota bacterium]|nr:zf-HC2 domain-containing protein [Acidobacteriota bacterium]
MKEQLSAYCHDELDAKASRQVAEHLIACRSCRTEFEEIKAGVKLAEHLSLVKAPDSLWIELESRLEQQLSQPEEPAKLRRSFRDRFYYRVPAAIAAALVLTLGVAAVWIYRQETRPSWEVARLIGAPMIGNSRIGQTGQLGVGQWLETDAGSRARISVASIGQVEIDPNTRVRLLETRPTEHRLELARGRMSAHIWAPPRLFFVDTPSAVAADLGCAYTLEVDDQGASLLRVTSGWVALQLRDRESVVPAGAACATRPGIGPGTPYFEDASQTFRAALAKLDFDNGTAQATDNAVLKEILSEARVRDTLTLWHLLYRVGGNDRALVYDHLAALTPPPRGVTREGVLQLDEKMLRLWKGHLDNIWTGASPLKKGWIDVWTRTLGKVKGKQ